MKITLPAMTSFADKPSFTIQLDESREDFLSEQAKKTLKEKYMTEAETLAQEAFARPAAAFSDNEAMAQRIYDYASKQWFGYASPILANGGTKKGLPISCFLNYVDDSLKGLADNWTENLWLTTAGGGIGSFFGDVRSDGAKTSRGTTSTGIIPFMKCVETQMLAYSQGKTRRGAAAIYLDISHPEIVEFINMRKVGGGDINRKVNAKQVWHHAVVIPDTFMQKVEEDGDWNLVDPHSKQVTSTVKARHLWIQILEMRMETGEPYLMFKDAVDRGMNPAQKARGREIHHSNLCSEITLPTDKDHTAVCCLSSVNLETYEEWKNDPQFIPDLIRFLDNVLEYFIQNAPDTMIRAINSAKRERSLGLGAMGFHALLQQKNIPFESALAVGLNKRIFKQIKEQADAESYKLAEERGCPEDLAGIFMQRNAHLLAIAPTATNADIVGTSPSIEPYVSNTFTKRTNVGTFTKGNKYLEAVLEKYNRNDKRTWNTIRSHEGSVQHLTFLSEWERSVFKTAFELDQHWIIQHAADRQEFICQSQSVNLFFPAAASKQYIHSVHKMAWQKGLKTLYYVRSSAARHVEDISKKIERTRFEFEGGSDCVACEG